MRRGLGLGNWELAVVEGEGKRGNLDEDGSWKCFKLIGGMG